MLSQGGEDLFRKVKAVKVVNDPPVEVGDLPYYLHYLQGVFNTSQVVWDFFHPPVVQI